jgi:Flp pilus assembly protein TadB
MNSERQKREEEIARIMREKGSSRETDLAFQEEIRKAAAAIIEKETSRIQKSERAAGRKLTITPKTAGLALLIAGAGVALFMPSLGALLLLCAVAAIVWATVMKSPKK